jgi:hypothetical protein
MIVIMQRNNNISFNNINNLNVVITILLLVDTERGGNFDIATDSLLFLTNQSIR